jgi:DNA-directed RNA polymerase subunit omega
LTKKCTITRDLKHKNSLTIIFLLFYHFCIKFCQFGTILNKRSLSVARITIEDCVDKVNDRFELVLLASERAKQLAAGSETTAIKKRSKKDKDTVIALREIAEQTVDPDTLRVAMGQTISSTMGLSHEDDHLLEEEQLIG